MYAFRDEADFDDDDDDDDDGGGGDDDDDDDDCGDDGEGCYEDEDGNLHFPLVGLYAFLHPKGPFRNIQLLAAWPNPTNADPLCHADLEGFEDWRLDNDMVAEQQDELEYDSGDEFGIEEQVLPSLFPRTSLPRTSILVSQS